MSWRLRIYIAIALLLGILVLALSGDRPKPVNWGPTYGIRDKNPLGLYVFDKEIDSLFAADNVYRFGETPYRYLQENLDREETPGTFYISGTLVSVGQPLEEDSVAEMLYFAAHGDNVFISAPDLPRALKDSLDIEVQYRFGADSTCNWTTSRKTPAKTLLGRGSYGSYFQTADSARTQVLGFVQTDSVRPNFIRVQYRYGYVYLHLQPCAFSNYYLLKDDCRAYAEAVASWLPAGDIHFSTGSGDRTKDGNTSLRFLMQHEAFRWAWYILIFGIIAFVALNFRRRQREVPVLKPLENTTVDFVQTIGNLYRQEGDHGQLVQKKIIYLLERIRQEYMLETAILDEAFIRKLHLKSGKPIEDIRKVVFLIQTFRRNRFSLAEDDLIAFNEATEKILN